MKKVTVIVLVVVMTLSLLAGCATSPDKTNVSAPEGYSSAEVSPSAETSKDISILPEVSSEVASTGYPIVDFFSAYSTAKNEMLSNLGDALSGNDSTAMASLSLLGVITADMYLLPVACFGIGNEAAEAALSMFGTDGQYTENGNSYTVAYKNADGKTLSLTGIWDAAASSMVCTGTLDGAENFCIEYRKTSYGYVGQYYIVNEDGTAVVFLVTVQGKDGAVGIISEGASKPAALTGSEAVDYPATCNEWYAISGATVTGKTSDGTAVNFEYTPEPSAS